MPADFDAAGKISQTGEKGNVLSLQLSGAGIFTTKARSHQAGEDFWTG